MTVRRFFLLETEAPRNRAMEGLRGYAVLLVYLVHAAGWLTLVYHGQSLDRWAGHGALEAFARGADPAMLWLFRSHFGVDLFFLMSGFLICRIVTRPGGFSYPRFLWHRFARIYPAFAASVLIGLGVAVAAGGRFDGWELTKNLLMLYGCPYAQVRPYNHVTWSLFYEAVFYAAFPAAFALSARGGPAETGALRGAAALALTVALLGVLPRTAMFFFGAVIGAASDLELTALARRLPAWAVAGAYLAVTGAYYLAPAAWTLFTPAYGLAATLLFVKACYGGGPIGGFFSLAPWRLLGNLSYSFYLIHVPVLAAGGLPLKRWLAAQGLPQGVAMGVLLVVGFASSLLAAVLLFAVCERWYFRETRRPTPAATPARIAA